MGVRVLSHQCDGLSAVRYRAITWTNDYLLSVGPLITCLIFYGYTFLLLRPLPNSKYVCKDPIWDSTRPYGKCSGGFFNPIGLVNSDNGLSSERWRAISWNNDTYVDYALKNKLQWHVKQNAIYFVREMAFKHVIYKMLTILSRPQCFKRVNANIT